MWGVLALPTTSLNGWTSLRFLERQESAYSHIGGNPFTALCLGESFAECQRPELGSYLQPDVRVRCVTGSGVKSSADACEPPTTLEFRCTKAYIFQSAAAPGEEGTQTRRERRETESAVRKEIKRPAGKGRNRGLGRHTEEGDNWKN